MVLLLHSLTRLEEAFTGWFLEMMVGYENMVLIASLFLLILVFFALAHLIWMPVVAASYILQAHGFQTADARRSIFFVPWTGIPVWELC